MQRSWNVFPFLITSLMTICKPCLEKLLNKIYQLFARIPSPRFHIIAISENTSKYDVSDSKEDTYCGVPLQQNLDASSQRLFQKNFLESWLDTYS